MGLSIEDYTRLGLDQPFDEARTGLVVNGRANAELAKALSTIGDRVYHPCPQAFRRGGVPRGEVIEVADWAHSNMFPNTTRHVSIYLPAQLDRSAATPLIVFNDGLDYLNEEGAIRACAVLDTLIAREELAPTVAVFVMAGRPDRLPSMAVEDHTYRNRVAVMAQRSVEYDTVSSAYVRFLDEELLPDLAARIGVTFTEDASKRAVVGISSGGICAFTAAWHRPESFGLVVSHCGSFVNIRGGHNYPYLIRSTERKPIKVFLTSGERDGNIITGSWPLANQQIAAALDFAGYEHRFEFGTGGHNLRHGGSLFADTLRWLFSDNN